MLTLRQYISSALVKDSYRYGRNTPHRSLNLKPVEKSKNVTDSRFYPERNTERGFIDQLYIELGVEPKFLSAQWGHVCFKY